MLLFLHFLWSCVYGETRSLTCKVGTLCLAGGTLASLNNLILSNGKQSLFWFPRSVELEICHSETQPCLGQAGPLWTVGSPGMQSLIDSALTISISWVSSSLPLKQLKSLGREEDAMSSKLLFSLLCQLLLTEPFPQSINFFAVFWGRIKHFM